MNRRMRWTPAYVAIGSNLSSPHEQVARAFEGLAKLPDTQLWLRSRLYASAPMGPQDQPPFVNAAAGLLTQLDAPSLLAQLQALESAMGRAPPAYRWGPRVIDLDLLLHGVARYESTELRLPHPGLLERNFVLYPLCDIAPEMEILNHGRVWDLARRLGDAGLHALT